MRVLVTGAGGQLGQELVRRQPAGVRVDARRSGELDVGDRAAVAAAVTESRPAVIVNAAAYTRVDDAETEREAAWRVNADGPQWLAEAARDVGARLVHVSTDFVFCGELGRAWRPEQPVSPVGEYGASKAAGEARVREALGERALIVRTAWVYAAHGRNFAATMLRLMNERDRLTVVEDQIGTPTWAGGLAEVIWQAVTAGVSGTHHWTDAGVASWYDFACAIRDEGAARGLVPADVVIDPIPGSAWPTPARRPPQGVLDKTSLRRALGITGSHWRTQLGRMLDEHPAMNAQRGQT
ncbi:dTDP-4-dehydrorhamnose reductase [Arhodomonas sp. SL1]|uniref:dTDP-4-dehydrorhamnose reductase n=1 Tax=Arhodomonas sp. SL1 TaxID=3425691 RepID=UPI003F884467